MRQESIKSREKQLEGVLGSADQQRDGDELSHLYIKAVLWSTTKKRN